MVKTHLQEIGIRSRVVAFLAVQRARHLVDLCLQQRRHVDGVRCCPTRRQTCFRCKVNTHVRQIMSSWRAAQDLHLGMFCSA